MSVKPIPEGYSTITPYLVCKNAAAALEFYKKALGASEIMRFSEPSGKVGHAEIKVGNSILMMADEYPDMGFKSPQSLGGTPVSLLVYVEDVDASFKRALSEGAKELRPVQDQFYGDRAGTLIDPFGHVWTISTHKEDLTMDEIQKRAKEAHKSEHKSEGGCC